MIAPAKINRTPAELVETLIHKHSRYHALAISKVGNDSDANDVLQDCYLKLNRLAAKKTNLEFVDEKHLELWLGRMVANECISLLRRNRRAAANLTDLGLTDIQIESGPSTCDDAIDADQILATLDKADRCLLELRYQGFKFAEIAKELGLELSERSVCNRFRRILFQLRAAFLATLEKSGEATSDLHGQRR